MDCLNSDKDEKSAVQGREFLTFTTLSVKKFIRY